MKPKSNSDFARRVAVSMNETTVTTRNFRRLRRLYWQNGLLLASLPMLILTAFAVGWFLAIAAAGH